jgi:hypothetical protein
MQIFVSARQKGVLMRAAIVLALAATVVAPMFKLT